MGISATGIGSGLDINNLVSQLMRAESAPLDSLKAKQSSFNAKLSAFGTLQSAISTFQTALKGVSGTALGALTATSSKTDVLATSVTASANGTPGTYAIEVTQLAQRHKLASAGITPGASLAAANSTMSITVAGKTTNIPAADYTVQTLSSAINAANAGVTATVVNDGTADHLVITAKDSGTANAVTVSATGSLAQFDSAAGTMTVPQAAKDALLKIDGLAVTKSSNTITDAIQGITLNLAQTNVGSPVSVTVARDSAAVKTAITAFVDAYNTLSSAVSKMTAYDPATKKGAVLNGDSAAGSVLKSLRKEITGKVSDSGALATLSDIGIAFQRDGKLAVDNAKLQTALDTNFDNVGQLFTSATGYGTRLTKMTTDMLATNGLIQSRTDGIKSSLKGMEKSQLALEDRLTQTEKRYRAQFAALDTMMSQMQSTSSFLTQQLASLNSNA
jgi:flagellar hook-associated protein 2